MTDLTYIAKVVTAVGNKFICGPMSYKGSNPFVSPKLWVTGSNPVASTNKFGYFRKFCYICIVKVF